MTDTPIDLVCISHLWWDWVWQRPQHLMSRLAHGRQVVWVEEPRIQIGPPATSFEVTEVQPHLRVARLLARSDAPTFWDRLNAQLDHTGAHPFKVSDDIREAGLTFDSAWQAQLEQEVLRMCRRGAKDHWCCGCPVASRPG